MKVIVLTQYFPPDSPGWIPADIAIELDRRGHDVRVLTTFPHYATGKVAEGYRQKIYHVERQEGIVVRRVPVIPSHSNNPVGRVANYMSFVCTARMARAFVREADVVYVHGTPATVAAPAHGWAKTLGIPFVYHVQDIWPESVTRSGFLPKSVLKFSEIVINRWLSKIYSGAEAVIAIAPTAQQILIQRGVPEEKCHLVFNWSREAAEAEEAERSQRSGLTLVYAGNLGRFQDLETVINAAYQLRHLEGFRLLIAGVGVVEQSLRRLVDALQAHGYIEFLGHLEPERMRALYREADFQVVPLKDLEIFMGAIPSKIPAGLAQGVPLISAVAGDVTQLVEEHGLGFAARPEDVQSLAAAFFKAYETSSEERLRLSRRSRAFYESNLSKSYGIDRIEGILQAAAGSKALTK